MSIPVTLSMIVRNAAADLPGCLASVRGAVDAMVIADTGSTDNTVEIARAHGARVVYVPWRDDFAEARNLAMLPITKGWVLSLDADERLAPAAAAAIAQCVRAESVDGYLVPIRNYVASATERVWDRPAIPNPGDFPEARQHPAYVEHGNVRLFRRDPGIYFTGRVHETVGKRIEALGGALRKADFCIHHFGLVADASTREQKNFFYRELGRRKVEEAPQDAQAHFELGLVEFDNFRNYAEARRLFTIATRLNERLAVAWFFRGMAELQTADCSAAIASFRRAESLGHKTALNAEALGDAFYNAGDFEAARSAYTRSLRRAEGPSAASKLGLAEVRCGRTTEGLARLRDAAHRFPASAETHDRLVAALVYLWQLPEAAEAALAKAHCHPAPEAFLRAASIWAQLGEWKQAHAALCEGHTKFPDAAPLHRAEMEVERELAARGD